MGLHGSTYDQSTPRHMSWHSSKIDFHILKKKKKCWIETPVYTSLLLTFWSSKIHIYIVIIFVILIIWPSIILTQNSLSLPQIVTCMHLGFWVGPIRWFSNRYMGIVLMRKKFRDTSELRSSVSHPYVSDNHSGPTGSCQSLWVGA